MAASKPVVGFVGLGNLGRAMVRNLLEHGWPVRVVDRVAARQQELVEAGAEATTAAELDECDVIAFVVPDERSIWEVLRAGEPLLDRLGSRHTVLVHSTVLPERVKELAAAVGATGARLLDVPVSGGPERAERGELTVFVGGEETALEEVRPLLDTVGNDVVRLGPIGAGAAAKLANQLVCFATVAALHEAVELAARNDVAEDVLIQAISTGIADSWLVRNWGFFDRVAADYDDTGVRAEDRPWTKDLREVLEAADSEDLELPVTRVVAAAVAERIEKHAGAVRSRTGALR